MMPAQVYPIPPTRWDGSYLHPIERIDRRTDNVWSQSIVEKFPRTWQAKLLARWRPAHRADSYKANLTLLERVRKLSDSGRGGISPDAGDSEICSQADLTARDFSRRLSLVESIIRRGERFADVRARYGLRVVGLMVATYARGLLAARGLLDLWPAGATVSRAGALKRLQDARWWRRTYRKLHARTVEASAIEIGLVSRAAGLYASDDAVKRRQGQNARNAAALESVTAVNDHLQAFTLAELAAKGTSNKTIRRVELLTRIAGFELIAKGLHHIAFMVTVSCPSRFHKCTTRSGRVAENPKYDGSDPHEAQKYLSQQWAKCRAAAARAGLQWYGFRIAEPQHDGTPHWHVLLFMSPALGVVRRGKRADPETSEQCLVRLVRRYFLDNESPNESGAQKHRIDFEAIDWNKGSAVGYVIKYISKNIDGHGVGLDLFGNDAITSSQRVEAWASTWRIRQFQQLGGAPVTVWRELRRLHADSVGDSEPDCLRACVVAVNREKTEPGVASIAWKKYIEAQGGITCARKDQRVKLLKEQTGELGRYGEVRPGRPIGVVANGVLLFKNHIHEMRPDHPPFQRPATAKVESERAEWLIVPGAREGAEAAAARVFGPQRSAASTWIHVNNCTAPVSSAPPSMFGPVNTYRKKLRKFRGWEGKPQPESNAYASQRPRESLQPGHGAQRPGGYRPSH